MYLTTAGPKAATIVIEDGHMGQGCFISASVTQQKDLVSIIQSNVP